MASGNGKENGEATREALGEPAQGGVTSGRVKKFRLQEWFDNPDNPGMTALTSSATSITALTRAELQSGKPLIGIAQTARTCRPATGHHIELASGVREGIVSMGRRALRVPLPPYPGNVGKTPDGRAGPAT
jgi:dihydroxy-acid dehydratase